MAGRAERRLALGSTVKRVAEHLAGRFRGGAGHAVVSHAEVTADALVDQSKMAIKQLKATRPGIRVSTKPCQDSALKHVFQSGNPPQYKVCPWAAQHGSLGR